MDHDWLDEEAETPKEKKKRMKMAERLFRRRKKKFLNNLALYGNVSAALKFSGWSRSNMRHWREQDALFQQQYEIAMERAADMLEAEATRRAVTGYDDVVVYQGKVVYHQYPPGHPQQGQLMLDEWGDPIPVVVRKYSDRMLELLLKAARPERFRENIEVTNNHKGGVLVVGMMGQPSDPKFSSWEEEAEAHQAQYRTTGIERQQLEHQPQPPIDVPPEPDKPKGAKFSKVSR